MIFVLATKGESWNTISIIGCLKNTLTLVLLILTISIHRSAERFEEPRSSEPLKRPNLRYTFDFKFQIWNTWKIRNHDWKWKRNIFVQCLRYFTLSTLPRIVSTFTRASLSIAPSSIGNEESTGIVVRVLVVSRVLYGGASGLRESNEIATDPIAILCGETASSRGSRFINRGKLINVFIKEKMRRDNLTLLPDK